MAAEIKVEVTLSSILEDWGEPEATEVIICWSKDKIHENDNTVPEDDLTIAENKVESFGVTFSVDKGKTKDYTFAKEEDGWTNTFMLQDGNYYRIGVGNSPVEVLPVSHAPSTPESNIAISQFSEGWVRVIAEGWGHKNTCHDTNNIGGTFEISDHVTSIFGCVRDNVQAFDWLPTAGGGGRCKMYMQTTFSPKIESAAGRGIAKPQGYCYMSKTEYNKMTPESSTNLAPSAVPLTFFQACSNYRCGTNPTECESRYSSAGCSPTGRPWVMCLDGTGLYHCKAHGKVGNARYHANVISKESGNSSCTARCGENANRIITIEDDMRDQMPEIAT